MGINYLLIESVRSLDNAYLCDKNFTANYQTLVTGRGWESGHETTRLQSGHEGRLQSGHETRLQSGHETTRLQSGHETRLQSGHETRLQSGHEGRLQKG